MKTLLVAQFDNVYYGWGELLLMSLSVNAKDVRVALFTVNLSKQQIQNLYKIHNNLEIINSFVPLKKGRMRRYFMANRKSRIFSNAIKKFNADVYLMLDTDMILVKPIQELLFDMKDNNLGIVYRESVDGKHVKINSSIIILKNDKKALNVIHNWKKIMQRSFAIKTCDDKLSLMDYVRNKKQGYPKPLYVKKGRWFWDQITFLKSVEDSGMNFKTLDSKKYIDSIFTDDSIIWSAHSGDKKQIQQTFKDKIYKDII
jgi:hypothetical protein